MVRLPRNEKRTHRLNSRPQMWSDLTWAMTLIFEFSRSYVVLTIWWPRSGVRIYHIVTNFSCRRAVDSSSFFDRKWHKANTLLRSLVSQEGGGWGGGGVGWVCVCGCVCVGWVGWGWGGGGGTKSLFQYLIRSLIVWSCKILKPAFKMSILFWNLAGSWPNFRVLWNF